MRNPTAGDANWSYWHCSDPSEWDYDIDEKDDSQSERERRFTAMKDVVAPQRKSCHQYITATYLLFIDFVFNTTCSALVEQQSMLTRESLERVVKDADAMNPDGDDRHVLEIVSHCVVMGWMCCCPFSFFILIFFCPVILYNFYLVLFFYLQSLFKKKAAHCCCNIMKRKQSSFTEPQPSMGFVFKNPPIQHNPLDKDPNMCVLESRTGEQLMHFIQQLVQLKRWRMIIKVPAVYESLTESDRVQFVYTTNAQGRPVFVRSKPGPIRVQSHHKIGRAWCYQMEINTKLDKIWLMVEMDTLQVFRVECDLQKLYAFCVTDMVNAIVQRKRVLSLELTLEDIEKKIKQKIKELEQKEAVLNELQKTW